MSKLIEQILMPPEWEGKEGHLSEEDLARLAEGQVSDKERNEYFKHLNQCAGCYQVFKEILLTLPEEKSTIKHYFSLALAASFILIFLIGGYHIYKEYFSTTNVLVASISMDKELKGILMEGPELMWESEDRVNRLAGLLRDQGLKVENLREVRLTAAYQPTKDLFGPKEILKIRIEGGIAHLEVVKEKAPPDENKTQ